MECVGNVDSETEAHWKQRADTPVVVTDGSTGSEKLGQPGDDAGRDGGSTDEYEGCREAGGCDGIGVQNRAEVSGKARGTALQHPESGSDPTIVKNSGGGPTGVIETKGVNVKKGDTPVGDGGTAGVGDCTRIRRTRNAENTMVFTARGAAGENGGKGGKSTGVRKGKPKRGSAQVVHSKVKKRRKL
ncbi:hypothetical protein F443_18514 [Phytophthora nicotianae P1569]|uniref:Uncharacterized protein n=1 Tax=Phytophthora nicotianae P1569 TaxID=1317065 RepID=V9E983_PHYNI|nr:hypothetical protein F443_18514 [Phytophthora nicotianae P1569]